MLAPGGDGINSDPSEVTLLFSEPLSLELSSTHLWRQEMQLHSVRVTNTQEDSSQGQVTLVW